MCQTLDRFILGLPVLFLRQYPYAWIGFVALWPHSPSMALVFLVVVVIGMLSLHWQAAAWVSRMQSEHASDNEKFYIDPPLIYILTASGIGIRFVPGHLDYRLFLPFREICRIERVKHKYQERSDTDIFGRTHEEADGLLLHPRDARGFPKSIRKLFIVPADVERFVEQLPYGFGNVA
jgi:hypothetical protein